MAEMIDEGFRRYRRGKEITDEQYSRATMAEKLELMRFYEHSKGDYKVKRSQRLCLVGSVFVPP